MVHQHQKPATQANAQKEHIRQQPRKYELARADEDADQAEDGADHDQDVRHITPAREVQRLMGSRVSGHNSQGLRGAAGAGAGAGEFVPPAAPRRVRTSGGNSSPVARRLRWSARTKATMAQRSGT